MSRRPDGVLWTKFWWQDYERDPGLRRCSLQAEALWMRLQCIMSQAQPPGHLLVGGSTPSHKEIARMVGRGLTERSVTKLMTELLSSGVYSITDDGVPYSRRMVRDAEDGTGRDLDVSATEWRRLRTAVLERDGFACQYCGSTDAPLEADHVEPFSAGGLSVLENLRTACKPCNRSKGAKSLAAWGGRA